MKKIIALVLSVAVICSLAGICSFAATPVALCDTGAFYVDGNQELSNRTFNAGSTLFVDSWISSDTPVDGFATSIDGGEKVAGTIVPLTEGPWYDGIYAAVKSRFPNDLYIYEYRTAEMTLEAGAHKLTFYGLYGNDYLELNAAEFAVNGDDAATIYTAAGGGIVWEGAYWLSNDNAAGGAGHTLRTEACMFKTDKKIYSVGCEGFWSSNPASDGQDKADITCKLYKFSYNYENSIAGVPVAEATFTSLGDDNLHEAFEIAGTNCKIANVGGAGFYLIPNEALSAGQYIFVVSETASNTSEHYLVIPSTQEEYDSSMFKFMINNELDPKFTTRFAVSVEKGGQFVALQNDTEVPSEAPQTGDMTVAVFAVIAVVALAAVVVFKKRVNA